MVRLPTVADTVAWGRALAASLRPGDVVALAGGLGSGKTHGTKGIVAGLGSAAEVSSPTFTLLHEYAGGRLPVFHFDFYRVESAAELPDIGWDDYLEAGGVVVVEWADKFPALIPSGARWFRFAILEDGSRGVNEGGGPG